MLFELVEGERRKGDVAATFLCFRLRLDVSPLCLHFCERGVAGKDTMWYQGEE